MNLLLKQVFVNLISNAVKYHDRPNGKIDILAIECEHSWQFTVIDDGPGIAPEHHQKIFEIFQTLAGQEDNKGTGVGLALAKPTGGNRQKDRRKSWRLCVGKFRSW